MISLVELTQASRHMSTDPFSPHEQAGWLETMESKREEWRVELGSVERWIGVRGWWGDNAKLLLGKVRCVSD